MSRLSLKVLYVLALFLICASPALAKVEKVEVCHLPSGDWDKRRTIVVGMKALKGHLKHGDLPGACPECLVDPQCDDGNICTVSACIAGVCENPPIDCGDGDVCTLDSCNKLTGCAYEPAPVMEGVAETNCTDGVDNDCDMLADDEDPDCEPAPICQEDTDMDGIADVVDNCPDHANADQRNSNDDVDCLGNVCDPDFTNDGVVSTPDFDLLALAFGSATGDPGFDPDIDMTGDGLIGTADFSVFTAAFGDVYGDEATMTCEELASP